MAIHLSGRTWGRYAGLTCLCGGGLYAALGISGSWDELIFGAVTVGVAAAAGIAAARRAEVNISVEGRWLRRLGPVGGRVFTESAKVTWAGVAWMRPRGALGVRRDVPFDAGQADAPADVGRRAVVVQALSAPPNSYVITDERPGVLVVHQLVAEPLERAEEPGRREWPL